MHKDNIRTDPLLCGIDPPAQLPPIKCINVRGREEHEAVIKDAAWCKELGLGLSTAKYRIACGWSVERTLTIPPRSASSSESSDEVEVVPKLDSVATDEVEF